jgi:hypothetical protein
MTFAMTDFAFLATAYARAATTIANSEDLAPGPIKEPIR